MKKILFLFVCFLVGITSYAQFNPPVNFESTTTLKDFGENVSAIVADPAGGSNMVVKTIKPTNAPLWAGTTIGGDAGFSSPLPFTASATTMSVRVYSPDAGIPVRLKVEDKTDDTKTAETEVMTTGVNTWETLVFDFSTVASGTNPYNPSLTFDKASIFFNFGTDGATAGEKTYYWDDVTFGGTAITSYCDTDVTHLGVAAETASAIKLKIVNVDAQSMKITIESTTADPVDDLIVNNSSGPITGSPAVSALDNSVAGKLSRTLTWTGTPPANIALNVLWSKMTQGGNSQLIGGGANTTVAFSESCSGGGSTGGGTTTPNSIALPLDFECEHTTYTFDQFGNIEAGVVADNPSKTGINTSNKVVKVTKTAGSATYGGTFTTLGSNLELGTNTVVKLKVYSPKAGIMVKLKLEHPTNNTIFTELGQTTTGAVNTWEEVSFDFAGSTIASQPIGKVVLIFDAANAGDGSVYYVDDIIQMGSTAVPNCQAPTTTPANTVALPLDFECEHTTYTFDQFGNIEAGVVADNPSKTGINTSNKVVKVTKTAGSATYGGTFTTLGSNLELGTNTVVKLKVYSPKAGIMVKLKLEHPTNNTIFTELGQTTTGAVNTWEEVSFDFAGSTIASQPIGKVVLIFDAANAGDGSVYYVDDIIQMGSTTVPNCQVPTTTPANTVALPLDFECEHTTYTFDQFGNIEAGVVADNPSKTGINTSNKVVKVTKTAGSATYGGTFTTLGSNLELGTNTVVKLKVYSPKAGIMVKLKLEHPTDNTIFTELGQTTTGAVNTWEEVSFDFAGSTIASQPIGKVILIFDAANAGDGSVYYVDDIIQMGSTTVPNCQAPTTTPANTVALPLDFECEHTTYTFGQFGNIEAGVVADNPSKTGINTSNKVVKVTKTAGSATYGGTFTTLGSNLELGTNTVVKLKVYSPKAGIMVKLKLEHPTDNTIFTELGQTTTGAVNTWEEVSFDFAGSTIASQPIGKVILIFDAANAGDGSIYYVDDIIQMGSTTVPNCQAPTTPTTAAATPPPCDNVTSIFSDAFTDLTGTNFNPSWGQATAFSMETVAGGAVLKYSNFNYQGVVLAAANDVSSLTHLHVDVWSPDATKVNIYTINSGTTPIEKPHTLNLTKFQWNSFDIPLTAFSDVVDLTKIDQLKFADGDGQIYFVDNLYFYGDCNAIPECPNLVWSDEFEGSSLDGTKWEAQIGNGTADGLPAGWGNSELQYYRAENATVAGGKLTITAKQESFGGLNYTSARLRTKGKTGGDITYGRFEASIKLPTGQGFWPAFWLLHTDAVYGPWPASGEIDIMELVGHKPDEVFATIHYGANFAGRQSTGTTYKLLENTFNDAFHTFAIEWDENVIRWYIDDYLYLTKTAADISPEFWPFNQNFHMLLNLAVGGTFPGSPDGTSVFPQTMEVDYVRVYKGQFPYLTGKREVANAATNEVYTVENAKAGSTFNWTVPAGATIVSGQGTKSITVNFGSTDAIGTISATEGSGCTTNTIQMKVKVDVVKVDVLECALENFDNDGLITYKSQETGTFEDNVANPATTGINSSALVGKFTRDAAGSFSNIQYLSNAVITDADAFKNGLKTFYMDVYSTATVGKTIRIQLEDNAKTGGAFPAGRHSYYDAVTTKQNEWERLVFTRNASIAEDGSVGTAAINQIVVLFDPGNATSGTYYFDNFEKHCTNTAGNCASVKPCITPATCSITDLAVSACPNGSSGTELITIVDANNPNCFASIEAPICNDGSRVNITFNAGQAVTAGLTTSDPGTTSGTFILLVNGQPIAKGGTPTGGSGFVFGGVITPGSGTAGGVASTGSTTPDANVSDPCNCEDTDNIKNADGSIRLFKDVLTFTGVGAVVCTSNCGAFLDANGNPITNFGNSPGTVDFYRVPGNYSASTFTIGGVAATLDAGTCVDDCQILEPIPTMSEWGLMIFGLLMLNLGLMFIYRKEEDLNI